MWASRRGRLHSGGVEDAELNLRGPDPKPRLLVCQVRTGAACDSLFSVVSPTSLSDQR